jgi:hypothetical protein
MVKESFEIVDIGPDGAERVLGDQFTSAKDAYIAVEFDLAPARRLPSGVAKRQVRDARTKEWVCEWAAKGSTAAG